MTSSEGDNNDINNHLHPRRGSQAVAGLGLNILPKIHGINSAGEDEFSAWIYLNVINGILIDEFL